MPIGIRHYFYLNEDSRIFVNGSFIVEYCYDSTVEYISGPELELKSRSNFAFGLGYKYNDRYGFELRYQTSREILRYEIYLKSEYKTISAILVYSIF